jgi:MoaE-MoaD fusion protein
MRVKVLFFGIAHDVTGFSQELAECDDGERLADLRRDYERRFPRLGEMAGSLVAVVNQEMAAADERLKEGDEVAFLPPVSGGAPSDFYRLTREPIPTQDLANSLKAPEDGAIVVFEGIVRNHSGGRRTLCLDYEAYEPMAVRKMREVGESVRARYPIDAIGMIHRLGRLEIGEASVAIFVTSRHRHAAFEACHEAINLLKQAVPIWKKEYFEDASVWAEGATLGGDVNVVTAEPGGSASGSSDRKAEAEIFSQAGSRSRT